MMKFELLRVAALFGALGATTVVVVAQQQPQRPQLSLDDALFMIFDSNKDGFISMPEVKKTMDMVAKMAGINNNNNPDADAVVSDEMIETRKMITTAINAAPAIFDFLDSDSSTTLSRNELKWANTIHSGFLSGGGMRNLILDIFAAINTNGDDFLDASELDTAALAASTSTTDDSEDVLSTIVGLVHAAYPVRKNTNDLKVMLQKGISLLTTANNNALNTASVSDGINYLDTNKDGKIDQKEMVTAYLNVKKKILKAAKTIIQMAPMAAMMMGGMGDMGDSSSRDGINSDL